MIILVTIGFIALVVLALYFTAAAVTCLIGEMIFAHVTAMSFALCAMACGFWSLAYWLSPFTFIVKIAS